MIPRRYRRPRPRRAPRKRSRPQALLHAVLHDNVRTLTHLLDQGVSINVPVNHHNQSGTVLHFFLAQAKHGSDQVLRVLLERGAVLAQGRTVLQSLVLEAVMDEVGTLPVIARVIKAGADVNEDVAMCKDAGSPLCVAAEFGLVEVLKLLLEAGADWKWTNDYGLDVLLVAMCHARHQVVDLLVQAGAEVNALAASRNQVLHAVLGEDQVKMSTVKLLVDAGVDVREWCSSYGWSPITRACTIGDVQLVELLLRSGGVALTRGKDMVGSTALQAAVLGAHTECVRAVLAAGADPNQRCGWWCALPDAAGYGSVEIVELLLDAGATLDAARPTALVAAAESGHAEVVKVLIRRGADRSRMRTLLGLEEEVVRVLLGYFPWEVNPASLLLIGTVVGGRAGEKNSLQRAAEHPLFDANVVQIVACLLNGQESGAYVRLVEDRDRVAQSADDEVHDVGDADNGVHGERVVKKARMAE